MKPPLPFVPGSEYAGVVEAVGAGVTQVKPGDAVAAFGGTGGFATHAVVAAPLVMPLPAGFAFDDAVAIKIDLLQGRKKRRPIHLAFPGGPNPLSQIPIFHAFLPGFE